MNHRRPSLVSNHFHIQNSGNSWFFSCITLHHDETLYCPSRAMEFIDTAEIWNGMGGLKPNGRFKYMYKTMEPITYPLNLANIRSSESKEHSCHSWNRHWVQNCMRLSVGLMATGRDEIDLERLLRLIRSFNTCPRQLWHVHILDWRKPLHTKLSTSFRYLYYTSHDLSCCCSCWNGGDVEHKGAELWWLLTSINLWALFAVGQLQVLILCISWSELQQL
jgi:hypothetical protein